MAASMIHRGPDEEGTWISPEQGIALGHRRLSILDLTPTGRQPMESFCGRYVIVLNGEIYNFIEIRRKLEHCGVPFRGRSDTEVALAAISTWGLEKALEHFVGMFAFALWDKENRTLFLVRDRMGEKPLYYGKAGSTLLFASELKALKQHPAWRGDIDRDALLLYLRYSYIPAPYSVYRDIFKLPPASILEVSADDLAAGVPLPLPRRYWSLRETMERGAASPFRGDEHEAADRLEELLSNAVKGQMISDVPLGAFLSGGVDSSAIVALMQRQNSLPVKTFTIGFHEAHYNEAEHAGAVAAHLGTDHTELYVSPEEAMSVIPRLPDLYDEPFADSSQIPTFLVAQLARRHVTVCLSGDAGDELFAGYNRHVWAAALWRRAAPFPKLLRRGAGSALSMVSPEAWNTLYRVSAPLLPSAMRHRHPGTKLHKLAEALRRATDRESLYSSLVSRWQEPESVVPGGREPGNTVQRPGTELEKSDFVRWMQYLDMTTYLPDDILVKTDRAAMGASLECRVPFLDHRVVEFAATLPTSFKIRGKQGKKVLRDVLYRHVPKEIVERPKTGFGIPIAEWLRGPLKEWAEHLLSPSRLHDQGFFRTQPVRRKWREHLSGTRSFEEELWSVLMFQAWLETNAQRATHQATHGDRSPDLRSLRPDRAAGRP
jgi:asparagine synthase (glutamine-hydrolysing)